jgi:5S rRNA maturation endonuclease (ribonuclease M5)
VSSQSPQLQRVLSRLEGVVTVSGGFQAKCPCRDDDDNPSFSVSEGKDGKVVVYCHAGRCDTEKACQSMGLTLSDLYPPKPKEELKLTATYNYYSEDGTLLFQKLRFVDSSGKKTFRQRKPDGRGGWDYKLADTPRVLYNLPAVVNAVKEGKPIFVVEGEKDVDTLTKMSIVATTMPNGAGTWNEIHTSVLAGATVDIIIDDDLPGQQHAVEVYQALQEVGCDVQVWKCAKGKDITDHLNNGGTIEQLEVFDVNSVDEKTEPEAVAPIQTAEQKAVSDVIALLSRDDLSDTQKLLKAELAIAKSQSTKPIDMGRLVDWSTFIQESDNDSYDWVIPGLLERGERVIVVAAEGVGKTMLARQVSICVGAGVHPFTFQPIKPMTTLSIDLENPERIIRRTSRSIYGAAAAVGKLPHHQSHLLIKPQGFDLLRADDRAVFEEHMDKIKPDILIMGPLYKAFIDPGGRTSEAVAIEIARYLDVIRDVYKCALWLEHHAPLGTSMTSRELRPFGSAVWSRWPEFGVALQPDPTGLPYHYDVRHFRGARDERQWPTIIKRGKRFPFEVVEFATTSM